MLPAITGDQVPMRNNGIDKKNPAMAHVLVMDAFFRYLVVLNFRKNIKI